VRLDISELLREVGKQMPYDMDEPPLVDEDVECTQPIRGRIVFTNAGGTLLIRGKAQTRVALPCSRCSLYFERPVELAIDEQFPLRHVSAGPRSLQTIAIVEEDESPIAGKLFDGPVFDLGELLRQYILLEQPTKPLPPMAADGTCSHCHLTPEAVLRMAQAKRDTAEPVINPAFAKLGELLNRSAED
jgi:uncharacterized metal-binding protein YceD (DUF177 family)